MLLFGNDESIFIYHKPFSKKEFPSHPLWSFDFKDYQWEVKKYNEFNYLSKEFKQELKTRSDI